MPHGACVGAIDSQIAEGLSAGKDPKQLVCSLDPEKHLFSNTKHAEDVAKVLGIAGHHKHPYNCHMPGNTHSQFVNAHAKVCSAIHR